MSRERLVPMLYVRDLQENKAEAPQMGRSRGHTSAPVSDQWPWGTTPCDLPGPGGNRGKRMGGLRPLPAPLASPRRGAVPPGSLFPCKQALFFNVLVTCSRVIVAYADRVTHFLSQPAERRRDRTHTCLSLCLPADSRSVDPREEF